MDSRQLEDMPALIQEYKLSEEQIKLYQNNGHILLRGVASAGEVSSCRPFITDAIDQYRKGVRPLKERDTYGKRRFFNWGTYED